MFDIRLHEAAEKEYNQMDGSVLDEVNKVNEGVSIPVWKRQMIRMVKIIIEADYPHLGDSLLF
ncbi:hypothetical protein [Paenibacillus sp. NRS-1780]|uniref:hypothetical protein n=1 Tax=Paenibacillus sp. NRS-1780 TaxID=3233904 RepID=UPI003D2AC8EE